MLTRRTRRRFAASLTVGAVLLLLLPQVPLGEYLSAPEVSIGAPDAQTISAAAAPDDDDSDLPTAGFDAEIPETSGLVSPEAASSAVRLRAGAMLSSEYAPSRPGRGPPAA